MSSNEVDDKIELHLIDTRELVEEARKLRKARDLVRANQAVQKKLTAGISPLGMGISQTNLPKGFFAGGPQSFQGAVKGAQTNNAFKTLEQKTRDLEAKIKAGEKTQLDFQKQVFGSIGLAHQITSSNGAALPSILLSKLGKFGIIGSLIAGAFATVIDEGAKQLQRGGVFSIFLKTTKQTRTLNDVDIENEERSGNKYITSDLRVVQKSPQSSNTSNIRFESIRYTVENLGRI
jgi:hypothetical protein